MNWADCGFILGWRGEYKYIGRIAAEREGWGIWRERESYVRRFPALLRGPVSGVPYCRQILSRYYVDVRRDARNRVNRSKVAIAIA